MKNFGYYTQNQLYYIRTLQILRGWVNKLLGFITKFLAVSEGGVNKNNFTRGDPLDPPCQPMIQAPGISSIAGKSHAVQSCMVNPSISETGELLPSSLFPTKIGPFVSLCLAILVSNGLVRNKRAHVDQTKEAADRNRRDWVG